MIRSSRVLTFGTLLLVSALPALAGGGKNPPPNSAPQLTLVYPLGTEAQGGAFVTFKATASDVQDGNLSAAITWTSNLRGLLGTGSEQRFYMNLLGYETITARVVDSGGLQDTEVRTLLVQTQVSTDYAIWHDPSRADGFLSFNQLANGSWIATWMGHEFDFWAPPPGYTHPVWYQSGVASLSAGALSTDLNRFNWDPAPVNQATATVIGDIQVQVETDSQVRLTITNTNNQNFDKVFEPWVWATSPGGAYWAYSAPGVLDPGWVVFRGPAVFGSSGTHASFVTTFDGSEPRWAMGFGQPSGLYSDLPLYLWWQPVASHFALPGYADSGTQGLQGGYGDVALSFSPSSSWVRPIQILSCVTAR